MLEDDGELVRSFEKAVTILTGCALRDSFVMAVCRDSLHDRCSFWDRFKIQMCDDLPRFLKKRHIPFAPGEHLELRCILSL